MMKRGFDILAAGLGLCCLAPAFLIIGILIKLDSRGPIFFRQERVGRRFRIFKIYKFRSMVDDPNPRSRLITIEDDPRITRVGRYLRKTKIDELPQLVNVLKGEMSIVGPRPEVRKYVDRFHTDYEEILTVRPGITDLASLTFRNEAALLAAHDDPEEMYLNCILPAKVDLGKRYVRQSSVATDVGVIVKTLAALCRTSV